MRKISKTDEPVEVMRVTNAILILDENYVLQLRSNDPNIPAPGRWGFFGGGIEKEESPEQAIKREILEELSIEPAKYHFLWEVDYFAEENQVAVRNWFFVADVTEVWSNYRLGEGADVRAFKYEELKDLNFVKIMRKQIERFHPQKEFYRGKFGEVGSGG